MGTNSAIEWTDHSWGPWRGCQRVSAGCKNCYMFAGQRRYGNDPEVVVRAAPGTFRAPLAKHGTRSKTGTPGTYKWAPGSRVFVCSWSDFWHPYANVWRADAFEIMRQRPDLIFQIPTKRPELIADMLPPDWGAGWPHVWLGVTVEDQGEAEKRIPILLQTPAAVRWVSAEPLISPVDLSRWLPHRWLCTWCGLRTNGNVGNCTGRCGYNPPRPCDAVLCPNCSRRPCWTGSMASVDWVVAGGESGPGARPMHPDWPRSLRDQSHSAGAAFYFKQWGAWADDGPMTATLCVVCDCGWTVPWTESERGLTAHHNETGHIRFQLMYRVGKKAAGRVLVGRTWDEFPEAR